MIEISSEKENILRGCLGVRYKKASHRNHFVSSPNASNYMLLTEMVSDGLMSHSERFDQHVFHATEAGAKAVGVEAPDED